MTDRELLELAAKAAGITHGIDRINCGLSLTLTDGRHESLPMWNPLTNDGDALRLAVKLRLHVDHSKRGGVTVWDMRDGANPFDEDGKDENYNTRRAIVRAAAEIGKDMQ